MRRVLAIYRPNLLAAVPSRDSVLIIVRHVRIRSRLNRIRLVA
jgi:hypothetical protein